MEQTNFIMFRYSIINFLILLYKNLLQKSIKNLKFVTALFLCFSLFSGSSCRKEKDNKDALPPETHQGLNKVGFLFNNELFRETGSFSYNLENPDTQLRNDTLSIRALHGGVDSKQTIAFGLTHFNGTGKYIAESSFIAEFYSGSYCQYIIDSLDETRYIDITYYDPIKKIISGTFAFKVKLTFSAPVANACDSVINITDGRFDLTYYKWN